MYPPSLLNPNGHNQHNNARQAAQPRVDLILHHLLGEETIYSGESAGCPPVPREGDLVVCGGVSKLIQGVEFHFEAFRTTVRLLC
jgi:hypothetical protein